MIEVQNLTKHYGKFIALDSVSFSIGQGQVIGLLGPNGAGKTTTMKLLTGFLPASSGSIKIQGLDIQCDALKIRSLIGYLPESNPLYEGMTVEQFLHFFAEIRGIDKVNRKKNIARMIDACMLQKVYFKPIAHLSKGYRQRVGLAQAMIHDPQILILDEPTSGLDPNQIQEMLQLIRHMGEKKTVIHSTHILSEAEETCDRVLILNKGRLVANDAPQYLSKHTPGHKMRIALTKGLDELHTLLNRESWVKEVSEVKDTKAHSGLSKNFLDVYPYDHEDYSKTLSDICHQKGYQIMELSYIAPSLDHVFSVLTQGASRAN